MRLLMLPRYAPLGASSRLRMYQYLPALRDAGFEVAVSPLFGDGYVRALYARRRAWCEIGRGYGRRALAQLSAAPFDVVWVEKELLPWLPVAFERLRGRPAVVLDYDDAVFHRYDMHRSRWVRRMLGGRIDVVMQRADMVTAGNRYLAQRAEAAGCPRVEPLPTVVDADRYAPRAASGMDRPIVIGWIGSPSTAQYLQSLGSVVRRLQQRFDVRAVAVGARPDQVAGTPFEPVAWSEDSETALVAGFDIGIMPLPDEPWERGKCGYKLIQYMACGLPVVASPVGANVDIVRHGEEGFLADGEESWVEWLSQLLENAQLRRHMGASGRQRVESWYSLQAQAPRLVAMLQDVARGRRDL